MQQLPSVRPPRHQRCPSKPHLWGAGQELPVGTGGGSSGLAGALRRVTAEAWRGPRPLCRRVLQHALVHAHAEAWRRARAHMARRRALAPWHCRGSPARTRCPSSRYRGRSTANRRSALPAGKAGRAFGNSGTATAPLYWSCNAAGNGFEDPRPPRFPPPGTPTPLWSPSAGARPAPS